MSVVDRLFQYQSTSADTDLTVAELVYTAGSGGPTMITAMWFAASAGATNNVARLHHCKASEAVAAANMLFRATSSAEAALNTQYNACRIILLPGDRLYAQLHSGSGFTLTAYGLTPIFVDSIQGPNSIARTSLSALDNPDNAVSDNLAAIPRTGY